MSGSLRWGLILLGGLCLMAFLPPPIDPVEQVDPPASLHRAPGTVLLELRLANGRILLADEVAVRGEEVRILRRSSLQQQHTQQQPDSVHCAVSPPIVDVPAVESSTVDSPCCR